MRNLWNKAALWGVTCAMLISGAVSAAPTYNTETDVSSLEHPNHGYEFEYEATEHVIDTGRRGILHIHKSASNQKEDVQRELGDVTYTLYRVADVVQGQLDESGLQISMEYRSLIKDSTAAGNTIAIPSGLSSGAELDLWVSNLLESDDAGKRMGNLDELPQWTETTDRNGNVTFDDDGKGLPLGIYIVYEAAYPSQVTDPQPFVVSIPTTSVEGDSWVYDVQAYPKNTVKELAVEKHIVAHNGEVTAYEVQDGVNDPSNDILTDAEDYEIGDTIRYWMKADVPATIGEIEVYYLLDRMSVGQTFMNDVAEGNRVAQMEVWGKTLKGDMVYIPRYTGTVENYRVLSAQEMENVSGSEEFFDFYGNPLNIRAADQPQGYAHENAFAVLFNTHSLSRDVNYDGTTKRVALYSEVYVTYNLTLNEKALVGDPGNVNDVALVLSHRITDHLSPISNEVHVPEQNVFEPFVDPVGADLDVIDPQCIDTRVYTYAVQVTKVGEGTENMEGVTFELKDSRGSVVPVSQYTEEDREWLSVDGCTDRIGDYYVDRDAEESAVITIDADQEVYLYGLEDGTYQLTETKTVDGYQLLRQPIVLTVVSDSALSAKPMNYQEASAGEYFMIEAGKGYFIQQNEMKVKIDVTGHKEGDYVAVKGEVFNYDTDGDDGSMSLNAALVTKRYSYRWTDSETLTYTSNYGMEEAESATDGIFDAARGMYQDGLFSFMVLNRHSFNIPSTGGVGTTLFVCIGTGVAGWGLLGIASDRKRRRVHDET